MELNTVPVSGGTGDAEVIFCKGDGTWTEGSAMEDLGFCLGTDN